MLTLRRYSNQALPVVMVLLSAAAVLWAQDADADRAMATLKQGIAQYKAMDFTAAKSTFLKVDRKQLADADKTALDDYLAKVDAAINNQASALSAYNAAVKALRGDDLVTAKEQFEIAAASEYLPEAVRRDARAQLALVEQKIAAVVAAPSGRRVEVELPPVTTAPAAPTPTAEVAAMSPEPTTMPAAAGPPAEVLGEVLQRRAKANQLVEQGKQALAAGDANQAAMRFQQALTLVPEMKEASDLLRQAQARITDHGGALTVLEQTRRIKRQQADVEFDKALRKASETLLSAASSADFEAAAESARLAENIIQANKGLYGEGEYRDRIAQVQARLEGIAQRKDDWERAKVQQQIEEMAKAEGQRAERAREQLAQQLATLRENATTLRKEQKYEEALAVVQQMLRLDPTNGWANEQADVLEQFIVVHTQKGIARNANAEKTQGAIGIQDTAIPWHEAIRFPRDWREKMEWIQDKGLQAVYGSEEDQRIRRLLKEGTQPVVTIDEMLLSDVLDLYKQMTGINIWPNWKYLESAGAGYTRDATVVSAVHLVKVSNEKALRVILEDASGSNAGTENELSYVVDGGVVTISTKADLARKVTQVVYNVSDIVYTMSLATRDLGTGTTGLGTGTTGIGTGTTGFGTGTTSGLETSGAGQGLGSTGSYSQVSLGQGTTGTGTGQALGNIISLITTTVDPLSWEQNGGEGRIYFYRDQLVVTQTAANHAAIADLISRLREAKEVEVAIEARFISVSTGYLENIGVDMDFYFNLGSRLGSGTTTDPWTGATVPTKTGTSGWGTDPKGSNKFTPIGMSQNSSSFTESIATSVGSNIGGAVTTPAMSLSGTFLDDIQVDFLIRATQAHSSTRTLTAPHVTLLSGTSANIFVGRTLNYVSQTTAETSVVQGAIQVTYTANTDTLDVGTELSIQATASADLKYVTLTVQPRIRKLLALTTFKTSEDPSASTTLQLPDISEQSMTTTVTVPDGGTLLLGGLKSFGEAEKEMGVPLLSKIPIINRMFTNRANARDEETLLILIKPTIIVPRDEEKRLFP